MIFPFKHFVVKPIPQVWIIGFGADHLDGISSNNLRFTILQVYSNEYCNQLFDNIVDNKLQYEKSYPEKINEKLLCASTYLLENDSCKGN